MTLKNRLTTDQVLVPLYDGWIYITIDQVRSTEIEDSNIGIVDVGLVIFPDEPDTSIESKKIRHRKYLIYVRLTE